MLSPLALTLGDHNVRSPWKTVVKRHSGEIAEAALAHVIQDAAERAYRRGDALEKRRAMMEAWPQWCEPKRANVVAFAKPGGAA
jgi:uncharacterized protein YcaQ